MNLCQYLDPGQKHTFMSVPLEELSIMEPGAGGMTRSFSFQEMTPKQRGFFQEYTFKPKVDEKSSQLVNKNSQRSAMKEQGLSHFQILHEHHQIWQDKKVAKRDAKRDQETQGCTFYPMELKAKNMNKKINRKTKVL